MPDAAGVIVADAVFKPPPAMRVVAGRSNGKIQRSATMHSSLIGKIQKAKQYAAEPQRVEFDRFSASFQGDNDYHRVSYSAGVWHCTCQFFAGWGICAHTMALERMLEPMIPVKQTFVDLAHTPSVSLGISRDATPVD
jgi:hypothetical protein